jgi:hexosaminidase
MKKIALAKFTRQLFPLGALLALSACEQSAPNLLTQSELEDIASNLQIKYEVVDNIAGEHCDKTQSTGACFISDITLSSDKALNTRGWALYFSQVSPVQKALDGEFTIEHVNGDLHKITPKSGLKLIGPDSPQTLRFTSNFWHLSKSDIMPNYYLASNNPELELDAALVVSTRSGIDPETGLETLAYAGGFEDTKKHLLRSPSDLTPIASPAVIFKNNRGIEADYEHIATAIVPSPRSLTSHSESTLDLSKGLTLALKNIDQSELDAAMIALADMGMNVSDNGVKVSVEVTQKDGQQAGSYSMMIGADNINIRGQDVEGAANALRSLASLVMPGESEVPQLLIEDSPRYEFRGLHIDVARNFHSKQLLLSILEQMASVKLNKLHLHLGDDEGWRLQIDGLPELTEIGSKRCHDLKENRCLLPQLGSGPDLNSAVNGYYSNADYIEILRYADARHIQVIPSFDMPGHSRAAVKSMEARYRKFMEKEQVEKAEEYLLSDPEDSTEYLSVQFYTDNTINACMDSSYVFLEKVITEVQELHQQAGQALTKYHIGADETAGAWSNSPRCQAFFADKKNHIESAEELNGYFVERVANMLAERGIQAAGWSDGLGLTKTENMPKDVQTNAWGPLFWDGHDAAHNQANRNWFSVVSTPDVTYFDTPYETDPNEPGYYWPSRGTNTRKVYNFMPDNLPANAEFLRGRQGEGLVSDDTKETLREGVRFKGLQAHIWSETIRSDKAVEFMLYPRLLALAERAWVEASWELPYDYAGKIYSSETRYFSEAKVSERDEQWAKFATTLALKVLPKLDAAGINYRIPPPGAMIEEGHLFANSIFPGLPIEYRLNGDRWTAWTQSTPVDAKAVIEVRSRSADGKRKSRSWKVQSGVH